MQRTNCHTLLYTPQIRIRCGTVSRHGACEQSGRSRHYTQDAANRFHKLLRTWTWVPCTATKNTHLQPSKSKLNSTTGERAESDTNVMAAAFKARVYQQELLSLALQRNVIAYLDTGAGKTLVAIMLVNERLDELRKHRKKAFFTAPTVHLVKQQAQVISEHVDANVYTLIGEMGVDLWDRGQWKAAVEEHDVFVAVPQVLLNMLSGGHIKIADIGLLIVDECHHVKGNAPGNVLMRDFYFTSLPSVRPKVFGMTASPLDAKGSNSTKAEKLFKDLEQNMDCKIVTVKDRTTVEQFAPPPSMKWVKFQPEPSDSPMDTVCNVITGCATLIKVAAERREMRERLNSLQLMAAKFPALHGQGASLQLDEDATSNALTDVAKMLDRVAVCAKELGPWCAAAALVQMLLPDRGVSLHFKAIQILQGQPVSTGLNVSNTNIKAMLDQMSHLTTMLRAHIAQDMLLDVPEEKLEVTAMQYAVYRAFIALLDVLLPRREGYRALHQQLQQEFKGMVHSVANIHDDKRSNCVKKLLDFVEGRDFVNQVLGRQSPSDLRLLCPLVSNKVTKTLLYLLEDQATYGADETCTPEMQSAGECLSWSCLIFVQRKITAIGLHHLIERLGTYDGDISRRLASATLIANGFKGGVESMTTVAQQQAVANFKKGLTQVLICSSVAEEGLDLRRCQLVLRFDLPSNARAFVQSRGRARMKNSRMVMMVDETCPEMILQFETLFREYEERMRSLAVQQAEDVQADEGEEEEDEVLVDDPDTVYRVPSTGATISLTSAKSLLFHYVQKLPSDKYHVPRPRFRTTEDPPGFYQAMVLLPNNAAVHQAEGQPQTRKALAGQSACLAACVELHRLGALTDNLIPVVDQPDMAGYEEIEEVEVQDDPLAPRLRAIPRSLTPAAPSESTTPNRKPPALSLDMYSFELRLPPDAPATLSHDPLMEATKWVVLVQKKLPELPAFPVWLRDDDGVYKAEMRLKHTAHAWLECEKVAMLQRGHQHLLSLVIGKQVISKTTDPTAMIPDAEWCSASGGIWYLVAPEQQDQRLRAASPIDWHMAHDLSKGGRAVADLMDLEALFNQPGSEQYRKASEELEGLVAGKIVQTIYNQQLYLATAVSPELRVTSPFPGFTFRGEETNGVAANGVEANRVAANGVEANGVEAKSYNTYQHYYEAKHHQSGLIPTQPLIVAQTRHSVGALKKVHYCMRPAGDKRADTPAERSAAEKVAADKLQAVQLSTSTPQPAPAANPLTASARSPTHTPHQNELLVDPQSMDIDEDSDVTLHAKDILGDAALYGGAGDANGYEDVEDAGEEMMQEGAVGEERKKGGSLEEVELVPQLCCILPLPSNLWRSIRYLLQLLHRTEWLVAAAELAGKLMPEGSQYNPPILPVLQCMTTTTARDHFSMERYELLGDTVLKLCATTHLFNKYKAENEALLTSRKNLIVSNVRLAKLGRALGFHSYMLTYSYDLRCWRPPGATHPPPTPPPQHVRSKRVADMMEALLGFIYHDLGSAAAVEYIVHTRILPREALAAGHIPLVDGSKDRGFRQKLLELARRDGNPCTPSPTFPSSCDSHGTREHHEVIKATGWRFTPNADALLKEAMTHASWPMPQPPCYQRLEFLGDAALDMVVTYLSFLIYPEANPGMLTEVRKATVNNNRLAYQSCHLKLHTRVLHFSSELQQEIGKYLGEWELSQTRGMPSAPVPSTASHNSLMSGSLSSSSQTPSEEGRRSREGTAGGIVSTHPNDWVPALRAKTTPPVVNGPKVLADIVESILAVVLLDSQYDMAHVASACCSMGLLKGISTLLQGVSECRVPE